MKTPSIKLNYLLNFLRVFSAALAGLITLPYLNRVLGVENMGKIDYVFTIINYFILFSALGIPLYGIREVSKRRDSNKKMGILVYELLIILTVTTIISYIIIFGIILQIETLSPYKDLLLVMSSMVLLSNIGLEWYFQGVENQKYITIRSIIVRVIVFCLVFLLIKSKDDYIIYALLFVFLACGANIINFLAVFFKFRKEKISWRDLNIRQHWKPILTIFVATVSVNIYLQLDYFLIGSISGDKYVGYYALANKLIRYILSFITIIGSVVLPRLSYLYYNDKEKYNHYLQKSFDAMMLLSIPASIYFYAYSYDIIMVMGGKEFLAANLTMKILSPLCIVVSIAYFFGFLIAYPQGLEKVYTKATIISACFSIAVNFYSIRLFQQNGAAVVALLSEFIAIAIMFVLLRKQVGVGKIYNSNLLKIIVVSILMLLLVLGVSSQLKENIFDIKTFLIGSLLFWFFYFIGLLLVKEKNTVDILSKGLLLIKK